MKIVVYNKNSGLISKTVDCAESLADLQCEADELWIETTEFIDDSTYKIDLSTLSVVPR